MFPDSKKIIVMAVLTTVGVSPDSCSLCDISRPYLEEKESRIDPILELVRAAGTTFYNQKTGRKTRADDLSIQCLLSQIEKDWDAVRKIDLSKEKDKNIDVGNKKGGKQVGKEGDERGDKAEDEVSQLIGYVEVFISHIFIFQTNCSSWCLRNMLASHCDMTFRSLFTGPIWNFAKKGNDLDDNKLVRFVFAFFG